MVVKWVASTFCSSLAQQFSVDNFRIGPTQLTSLVQNVPYQRGKRTCKWTWRRSHYRRCCRRRQRGGVGASDGWYHRSSDLLYVSDLVGKWWEDQNLEEQREKERNDCLICFASLRLGQAGKWNRLLSSGLSIRLHLVHKRKYHWAGINKCWILHFIIYI